MCDYLPVQKSDSAVFQVFKFYKRCGLWKILLALLVGVYGVSWIYGQMWIEVSHVIPGYGFANENKRNQSLLFATLKLEHFTMPFLQISRRILI